MKKHVSTNSRQIAERLVEQFRRDGLSVGDRLPSIRELACALNVAPTLMRDAIVLMQGMGLVKMHPRSGTFVQTLNIAPMASALAAAHSPALMQPNHNPIYLLDAWRIIELEIASQAAQRRRLEDLLPMRESLETLGKLTQNDKCEEFVDADIQFHLALAHNAGNPVLTTIVQSMLSFLRKYLENLPWTQERQLRTQQAHEEIYSAVLVGDVERARNAVQRHLGLSCEQLLEELQAPLQTRRSNGPRKTLDPKKHRSRFSRTC